MKNPIRILFLLLPLLLLAAGCSTALRYPREGVVHTLAGNPRLPQEEIEMFYGDPSWNLLKNRPYTAYVVFRGQVFPDRTIRISRPVEAWPDLSRMDRAMRYATEAQLLPFKVGTRVRPTAEVFVVFYETAPGRNTALVFAKQLGVLGPFETYGESRYLSLWEY